MKTLILSIIGFVLVIAMVTCKKDKSLRTDIYVAGATVNVAADAGLAAYWKNGALIMLENGTQNSLARAIVVSNGDVYVAGFYGSKPCYWKNGTRIMLDCTYDVFNEGEALAIAVKNDIVYITGNLTNPNIGSRACYWKNEELIILGTQSSTSKDIFLSGDDIYISGSQAGQVCYWKNGEIIMLNTGVKTYSIFIQNEDVFVLGTTSSQMGYWKNGVFTALAPKDIGSSVQDLFVINDQIYVVGLSNNKPIYWHNGVSNSLSHIARGAYGIEIVNDVVYIAGETYSKGEVVQPSRACYWENNKIVSLGAENAEPSYGLSIFIHQY